MDAFVDFSYNIKYAPQRIGSFQLDQGGSFFLEYMRGGPGLEKRRIGEMIMFDDGPHIILEYLKGTDNKKLNNTIGDNLPFSGGGNESKNLHDIPTA